MIECYGKPLGAEVGYDKALIHALHLPVALTCFKSGGGGGHGVGEWHEDEEEDVGWGTYLWRAETSFSS